MGAGLRLALLISATILGNFPPAKPPGWLRREEPPPERCPTCGTLSYEKHGKKYWCDVCRKRFRPR